MMVNPLIGMPEGAEWLVILVIVILVFGAAKLPDLARSSGQALRIFKAETKGLRDDDKPGKPGKDGKDGANDAGRSGTGATRELPTVPGEAEVISEERQPDQNNG